MEQALRDQASILLKKLPAIKKGLKLTAGDKTHEGAPTATLFDTDNQSYYWLNWGEIELYSFWSQAKSLHDLYTIVKQNTTYPITIPECMAFYQFIVNNGLSELVVSAEGVEPLGIQGLVQKYFYWKIPLIQPDAFLTKTVSSVRFFFSNTFKYIVFAAFCVMIYLLSGQWESYGSTFTYFYAPWGIAMALVAYLLVKILHEFGHAYALKIRDGKIPSMGVVFLFAIPVFYTDTTHAWPLSSRKRMGVDMAGIAVELVVAILATYLWLLLDEGPLRSAAFIVSSTSWIVSLSVNANPLMKFDGYYCLSDYWRIPNLLTRSREYVQWLFRTKFFVIKLPRPVIEAGTEKRLFLYGILSQLYRLLLVFFISVMVYSLFFKALGLLLIVVNIVWLVLIPIAKEALFIWSHRSTTGTRPRVRIAGGVLAMTVALAFVPYAETVSIPAVLDYSDTELIYAPEDGKIEQMSGASIVEFEEGDLLVALSSTKFEVDQKVASYRLEQADILYQQSLTSENLSSDNAPLLQQKQLREEQLHAAAMIVTGLNVEAKSVGRIIWRDDQIIQGDFVTKSTLLMKVSYSDKVQIIALLPESAWEGFRGASDATFYPSDLNLNAVEAALETVYDGAILEVSDQFFPSTLGGDVAVRVANNGALIPVEAQKKLMFLPVEILDINRPIVGTIRISLRKRSFFSRVYDAISNVMISL